MSLRQEGGGVIQRVLVTGGTGYLGRALVPELLQRGHRVRLLVRAASRGKLPAGAEAVVGNALIASEVAGALKGMDTLVHLVGVPKPSPLKARQFREIDLVSIQAAVTAVERMRPRKVPLVYLSVAQPAPVMRAYVAVRVEGEALIRARGINATCLRPWYVLGPGHRWPYVFVPLYAVLRRLAATRAAAERLGFVTLHQMVCALVQAVEQPATGVRVVEVPEIRACEALGNKHAPVGEFVPGGGYVEPWVADFVEPGDLGGDDERGGGP